MDILFGLIGIFGMLSSIIYFVVCIVRKESKKIPLLTFIIAFFWFMVGVSIAPDQDIKDVDMENKNLQETSLAGKTDDSQKEKNTLADDKADEKSDNDESESKSIEKEEDNALSHEEDPTIELISGELGEYGEKVSIDGSQYIWYHIPQGKYKVESGQNNNALAKLYLDKNATSSEPENVKTLSVSDFSEEQIIEIKEDEHIEITLNSEFKLIPVNP